MQSDTTFWCLNALSDLSIKFPDLFQETINLVIYRHFLGSSRSGHPVTSSYGLKLPRVHENLFGHLSRVYREASVGSWSTVSRWVRRGIELLLLLPAQQSGKSRCTRMRLLQSIIECYRVLQSITDYYKVLQSITKTNLAHLLRPIFGLVSFVIVDTFSTNRGFKTREGCR